MSAYYNEIDPYAAQWLRNLIAAGHIAPGDVDERSIIDVQPDDLRKYTQCHFFAGIGGWSYALRDAGWPDERPVWTGSCPCQPFSAAGKQEGHADERHIWPHWFRLIRELRPPAVYGEQVAGAIAFGWLDEVFNDLEAETYSCAAAVLPACSVGAPHKRDRLWFVGNPSKRTCKWNAGSFSGAQAQERSEGEQYGNILERPEYAGASGGTGTMADTSSPRSLSSTYSGIHSREKSAGAWDEKSKRRPETLANSSNSRIEGVYKLQISTNSGQWLTEPAVGRVANGIPARSHKLRAYGNAIVPQVAAEFIKATM